MSLFFPFFRFHWSELKNNMSLIPPFLDMSAAFNSSHFFEFIGVQNQALTSGAHSPTVAGSPLTLPCGSLSGDREGSQHGNCWLFVVGRVMDW